MTEEAARNEADLAVALQEAQAQRVETCLQDIEAALVRHKCKLDAYLVIRRGDFETHIQVVPL